MTEPTGLALTRHNYILIGIGLLLLVIGYSLLAADKFVDATQFSIGLHVAPVVILSGYAWLAYAIMARPKKKDAAK